MKTRGFVTLAYEAGYDFAMYSLSKPYSKNPTATFPQFLQDGLLRLKMDKVANRLAWKTNGENKFLRFMVVYIDILAPRNWWAHFDTYKVGTVAQSNSIGNKISSTNIIIDRSMCEDGTLERACGIYNDVAKFYKGGWLMEEMGRIPTKYDVKNNLPEGFLQSRAVKVNYAVLQTMWYQRHEQERHPFWQVFFEMYDQLEHVYWAKKAEEDNELS